MYFKSMFILKCSLADSMHTTVRNLYIAINDDVDVFAAIAIEHHNRHEYITQ